MSPSVWTVFSAFGMLPGSVKLPYARDIRPDILDKLALDYSLLGLGLGIAILPDWLVDEDLQSRRLVRVLAQWKTRDLPLHVVYAGQRLLPARVSAFIDFAVAYMTRELAPYP